MSGIKKSKASPYVCVQVEKRKLGKVVVKAKKTLNFGMCVQA